MKVKGLFIASLFAVVSVVMLGQAAIPSSLSITSEYHFGDLIKIHGQYPVNEYSNAFKFDFGFPDSTRHDWHELHGYPLVGFSVIGGTYGNDRVLGSSLTVTPFVSFYRRISDNIKWNFQAGLGAAYWEKPYDYEDNPANLVIGTQITAQTYFQTGFDFAIGKQWDLRLGGSFMHYSNVHLAVPNIGANIVNGFVGLRYFNPVADPIPDKAQRKSYKSRCSLWKPTIRIVQGFHEMPGTLEPKQGPMHRVHGLMLGMTTTSGLRSSWTVGAHYYFYQGYRNYIIGQQLFDDDQQVNWRSSVVGFFGGREWYFGRLHALFELNVNVHSPFLPRFYDVWDIPKGRSYDPFIGGRVGFRYFFIPLDKDWHEVAGAFNTSIAVKSNGGTADFLELTLGYVFK